MQVISVFHKWAKLIAIKYNWVREHVDPDGGFGTATLIHVRTKDQAADIFTKFLTGQNFVGHRERSLGELRKDSESDSADSRKSRRR